MRNILVLILTLVMTWIVVPSSIGVEPSRLADSSGNYLVDSTGKYLVEISQNAMEGAVITGGSM